MGHRQSTVGVPIQNEKSAQSSQEHTSGASFSQFHKIESLQKAQAQMQADMNLIAAGHMPR